MFLEHKIRIFEWFLNDCDTGDWSKDAENAALLHRNKLYFKVY